MKTFKYLTNSKKVYYIIYLEFSKKFKSKKIFGK